jgi:putative hydrolase of the HAD superfamily
MYKHFLFDWGDTLMLNIKGQTGPMYKWDKVLRAAGAYECLEYLHNFAKCHIATNAKDSSSTQIRKALKRVGLAQFIDHIFCFKEIGYEKPSQEFFEHIINKLGCLKSEVVMIGDSLETDVYGAKKYEIESIWLNNDQQPVPEGITAVSTLPDLITIMA